MATNKSLSAFALVLVASCQANAWDTECVRLFAPRIIGYGAGRESWVLMGESSPEAVQVEEIMNQFVSVDHPSGNGVVGPPLEEHLLEDRERRWIRVRVADQGWIRVVPQVLSAEMSKLAWARDQSSGILGHLMVHRWIDGQTFETVAEGVVVGETYCLLLTSVNVRSADWTRKHRGAWQVSREPGGVALMRFVDEAGKEFAQIRIPDWLVERCPRLVNRVSRLLGVSHVENGRESSTPSNKR
jgi:hypothetical protein